jgi:hypothetical protein
MREPVSGINPGMLVWARHRSGQSIEEAAKALGKEPAVIKGTDREERGRSGVGMPASYTKL